MPFCAVLRAAPEADRLPKRNDNKNNQIEERSLVYIAHQLDFLGRVGE
jgi:hypothetical protein